MVGHPFLEIHCILCKKPVDLSVDLSADENGKAVHVECYAKQIRACSESISVRSLIARWLTMLAKNGTYSRN